MTYQTVVLLSSSAIERRDLGFGLMRFGYEPIAVSTREEALDTLNSVKRVSLIIVEANADGLAFAKEASAARPGIRVIYMAEAPHRVQGRDKVPDAPIIRSPCAAHQLAGIISGFTRRPTEDRHVA